ncbi:CvfB family protein [Muriicola soli]|uniref:GntR family transcriptional regulator n=1 Tax=Muriicola soli TaxID=2507538 RepID=A0A411E9K3_9FLAO|nr:S1-like domain-containing RNA-binding protein [Muriicola soli]QBA64318.1 GntR family transcriptional regulator [Muriicola soli]
MIELGNYNELTILRSTSVGLFLGDEDVDDLLLPTKYAPEDFEIGQKLEVFCYLDHEERPIATTLKPFIKRNSFAYLRVAEVNEIGAFMDWGLEKHLLVPYREQRSKMVQGSWEVVYCYLDEKSFRLVGSSRLSKFLSNENTELSLNEEVSLLVYRRSDLGWDVVVNGSHRGLIFHSDVFQEISVGDKIKGYVKQIRPDKKLDIALQPIGLKALEPAADLIYQKLLHSDGFLNLNDSSSPEEIRSVFSMSKKTFKKAIGTLYKAKRITLEKDGIQLVK